MQCELKNDRMDQCARIGRDLGVLDRRRQKLIDSIRELEESAADLRSRIAEIDGQIASIQFAEDVARSARSQGPAGAVVGEVTAQAIRLAMQRDQLEREKQRLEAQLSRVDRHLNNDQRQFEQVDHNLNVLNSAFANLNCPLGLRDFG